MKSKGAKEPFREDLALSDTLRDSEECIESVEVRPANSNVSAPRNRANTAGGPSPVVEGDDVVPPTICLGRDAGSDYFIPPSGQKREASSTSLEVGRGLVSLFVGVGDDVIAWCCKTFPKTDGNRSALGSVWSFAAFGVNVRYVEKPTFIPITLGDCLLITARGSGHFVLSNVRRFDRSVFPNICAVERVPSKERFD